MTKWVRLRGTDPFHRQREDGSIFCTSQVPLTGLIAEEHIELPADVKPCGQCVKREKREPKR